MQRTPHVRAGAELLGVFFIIALTGLLPAGVLYWLMRPTIVVNPGLAAYRAPRPDPLLHVVNSRAAPLVAAKQQTNAQADGRSAFAAAQKNSPEVMRKKRTQVRAQAHAPRTPSEPAFGALGLAGWYRE
jgi:hypothetical protein